MFDNSGPRVDSSMGRTKSSRLVWVEVRRTNTKKTFTKSQNDWWARWSSCLPTNLKNRSKNGLPATQKKNMLEQATQPQQRSAFQRDHSMRTHTQRRWNRTSEL